MIRRFDSREKQKIFPKHSRHSRTVRLRCGGALLAAALALLNTVGGWCGARWPGANARAVQTATVPSGSVCWQADLTHDGQPEQILFDVQGMEQNGYASFTVQRADGTRLYEATLSASHVGWNTFALYTDPDGRAWLLQYQPYFAQSAGEYSYALLDLTGVTVTTKESGTVAFSAGMPYTAPDNDVDALDAFAQRVNALWASSALLVTTDATVRGNLADAQGEPYEPMQLNCTVGTLENPLRYTECMEWTALLTDEEPEYAAFSRNNTPANLRARLEAGNVILARHRAAVADGNASE
jgi:hypothetical protein